MSLGRRLFKAAGHRIRQGVEDALNGARHSVDDARAELQEHLRRPDPPRSGMPHTSPPGARPYSPPPPPPHPYTREYRLLGAPVGSDLKTVQASWRKLVRETHPDRFAGDPQEQRRATERLRKINEAYDRLKIYLEPRARP